MGIDTIPAISINSVIQVIYIAWYDDAKFYYLYNQFVHYTFFFSIINLSLASALNSLYIYYWEKSWALIAYWPVAYWKEKKSVLDVLLFDLLSGVMPYVLNNRMKV